MHNKSSEQGQLAQHILNDLLYNFNFQKQLRAKIPNAVPHPTGYKELYYAVAHN